MAVEALIEKIRTLSPEKAAEVEDFVDFLRLRAEESRLNHSAGMLSEEAFAELWDTLHRRPRRGGPPSSSARATTSTTSS